MTAPKLTPAMRRTLEAVARGEVYVRMYYRCPIMHFGFAMRTECVGASGKDINSLALAGLIAKDAGSDHLVAKYELTEAGRKALEEGG